ncbi:MAG: histidine kinase [Prevotella sp.]|nr:histidine kinase [Prevotella sp.]
MSTRRRFTLAVLWLIALCCMAQQQVESSLSYRRFTTLDGLPQMQTETVWQDSRGYIYIGTLSGFVRYDGVSLTPFLRGQRENIVGFQEVDGKARALGFVRQWTVSGDEATMAPIDPEGELLLNNFNAADLPPGYVLLEDREEECRVICQMEKEGMTYITASPLFDDMTPDRKLFLDGDYVYVPTAQGLYRVGLKGVPGSTVLSPYATCLSTHDDVFSLVRRADKLFALAADGIYSVEGDSLTLRCEHHFEAPDYGLFVRQNRQGQLVIADSHTIWLYDPDADTSASMRQLATGFNLIKGIFIDKWNRLWAATYQGAYCFFHCNFETHRLTDRNDIVRAMAVLPSSGQLVLGTLNGRVLVDGRLLSSIDGNFYAPSAVALDRKVYMAGNGDVAAVWGDSLQWLGLPQEKYLFVSRYDGRLIIGTRGSILSYSPDSQCLDTLTTEIVRPWCAVDDGQGRLWVSGNPGLYCLTGVETGNIKTRKVKSTPSTLVITAMAADVRGHICFARGDSLFAICNGEITTMDETLPTLKGHEIRTVHLSPRGYLVVAAIDGLLAARLNADGHASDIHWFDATSGFSMIEPLTATMAESDDGTVWMAGLEEMTSFRPEDLLADSRQSTIVEAPRPWWQQWWAWVIAVGLLSLLVWRVARWFEQRQARMKMEHLEREKKQKELQLSAVRLKAIPHFHSNVLASIEYFVMNHSTGDASHYLKLYSDFTNQTLSDIDRPARSVAEEVDYVRSYLELEQLRYGERLQYSIQVDAGVDQNVMLPTMLLHTYCQNAVKHGIANKAGAGSVMVTIIRQQRNGADGLLVTVSDDGVGRSEAAQSSGSSTKQGLKILHQQIELYNRANRYQIVQQVTDLTDAEGRPAGTCFETWVPTEFKY